MVVSWVWVGGLQKMLYKKLPYPRKKAEGDSRSSSRHHLAQMMLMFDYLKLGIGGAVSGSEGKLGCVECE